MKVTQKQVEAVFKLSAPKRYSHFIKVAVDWEKVWGLYNNGWAMSEDDRGKPVFPLWPAKGYAEACANGEWRDYHPESIDINEFVNELLPLLNEKGISPGIFFVPEQGSVDATIDTIIEDLLAELERYK